MSKFVVIKEIKNDNGSWELDHKHILRAWRTNGCAEQEVKSQQYNYVCKKFEYFDMDITNLDKHILFDQCFSDKVRFSIIEMVIHY